MKKSILHILALASAFVSLGAAAQPTSDAAFLRLALTNGTNEIDRARIAAGSTFVTQRDYALQTLADATTINTQLEVFAHAMGVRPGTATEPLIPTRFTPEPSRLSIVARERMLRTTLAPVPYFRGEVASRSRALELFQHEAQSGTDARVRGYAKHQLTLIGTELAQARSGLKKALSASAPPRS